MKEGGPKEVMKANAKKDFSKKKMQERKTKIKFVFYLPKSHE